MWLIYSRLLLRLIVLVVIVFSIFYFYVFGYKYTDNLWFSKNLWVFNIKYISKNKNNSFFFDWKKYFITNNNITIFGLNKNKCNYIQIWDYKKFICNTKNKFSDIIYISKKAIRLYPSKISFFTNLNLRDINSISIKYWFKWDNINFIYTNNWDLLYTDSISTKKLINIPNAHFIWYNKKWLFLILKGQIYFLKIIK